MRIIANDPGPWTHQYPEPYVYDFSCGGLKLGIGMMWCQERERGISCTFQSFKICDGEIFRYSGTRYMYI